jgi:hypothetical protein
LGSTKEYSVGRVLVDQGLQRQVDSNQLARLHQWRAAFGIAEYQDFRGTQLQVYGRCSGAMIDARKHSQACSLDSDFQARASIPECPRLRTVVKPLSRSLRAI